MRYRGTELPRNWRKETRNWREMPRNWHEKTRNWREKTRNWREIPRNWHEEPRNWHEEPRNWPVTSKFTSEVDYNNVIVLLHLGLSPQTEIDLFIYELS